MSESANAFNEIVWPVIHSAVGGGELVPVESVTSSGFASTLDQVAGVDAWIVQQDRHVFGLASRVQWDQPYKTFTVRTRRPNGVATEFEKRYAQIATPGSLYPRWTCQAYVDKTKRVLLCAAIVLTEDLINAVVGKVGYQRSAYDGVQFWVAPWSDLWLASCASLWIRDLDGLSYTHSSQTPI